MPYYDITVPLTNEMPTYPGDPGIQVTACASLANGDSANVTHLNFGAHTGTHVDAPAHFIEGASKVEAMDLDALIGRTKVVEVPLANLSIGLDLVAQHCTPGDTRVLFKTRNSSFWNDSNQAFRKDFTYLEFEAAQELVRLGVRLVGIDYLSIEQFGQSHHPTHLALLSKGVVILEGLNLLDVPAGEYELICLPLRVSSGKGDGAPARAVLRTIN
jgi:arylformamidase